MHKVTLNKPHTHQGADCKKGDTIRVNDAERAFLVKFHVIDEISKPTPKKPTKEAQDA